MVSKIFENATNTRMRFKFIELINETKNNIRKEKEKNQKKGEKNETDRKV